MGKSKQLLRLELTTAADNQRAGALYKKLVFCIEEVRKSAILLGDQLVDSCAMPLLFPLK